MAAATAASQDDQLATICLAGRHAAFRQSVAPSHTNPLVAPASGRSGRYDSQRVLNATFRHAFPAGAADLERFMARIDASKHLALRGSRDCAKAASVAALG